MIQGIYALQVFDVTKYGAKADGKTDNANAFLNAWGAACEIGSAGKVLVPKGAYYLGPVSFRGPCANNGSPTMEIQGTIVAPEDLNQIKTVGWIEFRSLNGLAVNGGGTLDGKGTEAWKKTTCPGSKSCKNLPITLRLIKLSNASITGITLVDSKGFHMAIHMSDHVKAAGLKIIAPQNSPNTDGCHVSGSTFVDISNLFVSTGDDCISVGPGTYNSTISGVTCSPGHGISIGSLGKYPKEKDVLGIKVSNCTIENSQNGVRVKTWAGHQTTVAKDLSFENIIVKNVSNPIIIDQGYCGSKNCPNSPSGVQISNVVFKNIIGNSSEVEAVNLICSPTKPCKNVHLEDIHLDFVKNGIKSGISSVCANIMESVTGNKKPSVCQKSL
ncbi:uncharacterized protein A4U43_C02F18600 [Asparagus officinalis]|uniref:Exopolygalacturonase n=2 Tax=Asparagus officinalis TaxID=4686 RepID=A0A5P1FJY0_ASPOF|nr:uncharacterized protein A4U43_C02F18600 [Asparagus officinalis]